MKALVVALLVGAAAPCAAQDRWQLTLHSDTTLWDLELVRLAGDTLVVRQTDTNATLRIPVMQLDELRLVRIAEKQSGEPDPRAMEAAVMGTNDLVLHFTLRDREERLEIIRQIFRDRPPAGP